MSVPPSGHFPLLTFVSVSSPWLPGEQASSTLNISHLVKDLFSLFHFYVSNSSFSVTILNLLSLVAFSLISRSLGTLNRLKDRKQLREEIKGSSSSLLIFVYNELGKHTSTVGAYALAGIINQPRNSNNEAQK